MPRPKLSDILDLSIAERIELVQEIWDTIADAPDEFALTQEQERDLDERFTKLREIPTSGASWEEVKASLKL
jgi:putative addiction module component (TIGR02574 family)